MAKKNVKKQQKVKDNSMLVSFMHDKDALYSVIAIVVITLIVLLVLWIA
ncbi:hypothetical protein J4232_05695 [Candidatus Woesearchaeota archaeon]|nr:hypothetical protein [Candidatus Woesearchaeota archaeon]